MSEMDRFKSKKLSQRAKNNVVDFPSRHEKGKKFVVISLDEAAEFAKAARTPGAMVWLLLFYMAWKEKSRTFTLSSELLARYGVNRWAKHRALARLAREGKIDISQSGHQSVVVTLRSQPKRPK